MVLQHRWFKSINVEGECVEKIGTQVLYFKSHLLLNYPSKSMLKVIMKVS